ncbi:MAG: formylglycine-generating enzyme family protein, partial [Bacteroidota bacterium]
MSVKYIFFSILLVGIAACSSENEVRQAAQESLVQKTQPKKDIDKTGMVLIPAGTFSMGGDNEQARQDEFPKHQVQVDSFWMDATEVTNQQFAEFVEATNYQTVAERPIDWEEMKKELPPNTPKPPDSVLQPGALVFV